MGPLYLFCVPEHIYNVSLIFPNPYGLSTLIPWWSFAVFCKKFHTVLNGFFSGTWETKVSNKEKREQRKKDKSSSDGSASPGGGDTPVSTPSEQPKTTAAPPAPANQKKKKGASWKCFRTISTYVVVPQPPQASSVKDLWERKLFFCSGYSAVFEQSLVP